MKRIDLQKVMKRAWVLFRETGKSFAVCLSKSWALYRLAKRMRTGVVSFAFEKADGTLRKANGTLQEIAQYIKGTGEDIPSTFKYYDVDKRAFRCFRIANLITVY